MLARKVREDCQVLRLATDTLISTTPDYVSTLAHPTGGYGNSFYHDLRRNLAEVGNSYKSVAVVIIVTTFWPLFIRLY
jgi:hypothetical protein